jgi:hypothetical protein
VTIAGPSMDCCYERGSRLDIETYEVPHENRFLHSSKTRATWAVRSHFITIIQALGRDCRRCGS